ncbi:MAG TPA: trimethylamine methyltransferase family protein [Candidatus Limnocylindrales bacterium]
MGNDVLDLWPEEAIEAIHEASLTVLDRVGVLVESPAAREVLTRASCVEGAKGRLRMPRSVVLDSVAACPSSFTLAARDADRSIPVDADPGATFVHNMGGARDIIDAKTGASRRATMADQVRLTRVMHHMANLHSVTSLVQPDDVPHPLEPLYSYLVLAHETDKPVGGPGISFAFQAAFLRRMAIAVTGADGSDGRYPVDLAFSPVSPLQLGAEVSDALLATVRAGQVAVEILPCPAAGTTAPGSMAAAVATQNAEVLAGVVLTQAAAPGTPLYYGPRLSSINPRTGVVTSGPPETGVASIAATLLARKYGLACDCYGPTSDSVVVDAQFGYEHMANALLGLAARPRFLSGPGENQSGVGGSVEALVIDDEVLNYAFYALAPRPWDADALSVDAIVEGLESDFGFLATAHTRKYLRSDFVRPLLSYRGGLGEWASSGRSSVVDLAAEKAAAMIANPPVGLPDALLSELCGLIDEAARSIGLAEWPNPRRMLED